MVFSSSFLSALSFTFNPTMQHNPSPSTHLPLLKPISSDAGYADYLAELTHELPFSVSQFGIVLVSALELRDRQNQDRDSKSKDPDGTTTATVTWKPNVDSPHFQCSLPVQDVTGKDVFTTLDVTIAGHANTVYARGEYALMQAAARAGSEGGEIDEHYSFKATAENFSKAVENDPVVQGHQNNVVAVMKEILEHPVANEAPPGMSR